MDSTQRSPRLPVLPPLQSQQSTPKKVGNNERRRRPPPPILTSPVTPTSGSSFTVVPSRSSEKQQPQIDQQHLYSSPFVTEVSVSEKRAPAPKVYISPFVGDPSVFRSPETLPNSSFSNNSDSPASQSDNNNYNNNRLSSSSTSSIFTNNVTMPNIEFEGFASSDSKDITMKALPALPPRTFSGPINAATKTTATSQFRTVNYLFLICFPSVSLSNCFSLPMSTAERKKMEPRNVRPETVVAKHNYCSEGTLDECISRTVRY